jgi:hypothetical protein
VHHRLSQNARRRSLKAATSSQAILKALREFLDAKG